MIQSGSYTGKDLARAFYYRGNAYREQRQDDCAIADYTEAVRLAPNFTAAFGNRGIAYLTKGQYDRAIADYTEAIRLMPDFALAFINRGKVYLSKGQYDRAIADFDQAMRLTSDSSFSALIYRGIAHFSKGDFTAAADSLLSANDLEDDGHVMLWRFLASGRTGQDGTAELSANAARLKTRKWPYPVIEFYLGRRSQDELRAAASTSEEKCEAAFYVGEWTVLRGNKPAVRPMLKTAASTCARRSVEYAGAVAELKRLTP